MSDTNDTPEPTPTPTPTPTPEGAVGPTGGVGPTGVEGPPGVPDGVLRDEVAGGRTFATGALPTPRHKLAAATPFVPRTLLAPPAQVAYVPKTLQMWGNDQYGVCVTSEEFFAKDCHNPAILLPDGLAIEWARQHGWLNGAYLTEVMDAMKDGGPKVGTQRYNDGPYQSVDYSNESTLRAALAQGPVKIAIDHEALPSGAGNKQGWYALGANRQYQSTDHCVGIAGYGPAAWLYEQLGVPLPAAIRAEQEGYLLFTWSTLGFVDHAWVMSTCSEAWVRVPTTVGVPPLPPEPGPTPPVPPSPPDPGPDPTHPVLVVTLTGGLQTWLGTIPITLSGTAVPATPDSLRRLGTAAVNWVNLIRDLVKTAGDAQRLVADFRTGKPINEIMADALIVAQDDLPALLRDLGLMGE